MTHQEGPSDEEVRLRQANTGFRVCALALAVISTALVVLYAIVLIGTWPW